MLVSIGAEEPNSEVVFEVDVPGFIPAPTAAVLRITNFQTGESAEVHLDLVALYNLSKAALLIRDNLRAKTLESK